MKTISKALLLIDDNEHPYYGWELDQRGIAPDKQKPYGNFNFEKVNAEYDTVMTRRFRVQNDSVVVLECNFTTDAADGFMLELRDENGVPAVGVYTKDGVWYTTGGVCTGIELAAGIKTSVKFVIDLKARVFTPVIGNVPCEEFPIADEAAGLASVALGIVKGYTGKLNAAGVKLYADYYCYEKFLAPYEGITPYDWAMTSENGKGGTVYEPSSSFSLEEPYYYDLAANGSDTLLSKKLVNACGDLAFECKFNDREGNADGFIGLDDVGVKVKDGALYLGELFVCEYPVNLWNTLRLEYCEDGLMIRLNGKDRGIFPISLPGQYDSVCFGIKGETVLGIEYVLVFPLAPLPSDYVSEPKPATNNGYHVGVHVFSSWHYGFWRGTHDASWDMISPYDEVTPYMGYYDEGIPEVSDFEVKWMCEHGIDFQLQCWYGPAVIDAPLRFSGFSHALHDGYFNSVYKKYGKIAIMWEDNFTSAISPEAFEKYLVPYFVEYYFKDPGYYTIDGMPVFSVYNTLRLSSPEYFGSVEGARKEMDFLRNAVKEAGFKGLILLGASGTPDYLEALGFDGMYPYNLGPESFSASFQKETYENILESFCQKTDKVMYVPTVSVGFNCVSRHDQRHPSISMPEYDEIVKWVRDEFLPDPRRKAIPGSWQSRMVLLSCWNEFDEGHYINPSNLHGFGFLDTLRRYFTVEGDAPHADEMPTPRQLSRIDVLYPEGHAWLRPLRKLPMKMPDASSKIVKTWDFSKKEDCDAWIYADNAIEKEQRNGALCGVSDGIDPKMTVFGLEGISTKDVDFIHVRAKYYSGVGKRISCSSVVYYATSAAPGIDGGKATSGYCKMKDDGYGDIYMPTYGYPGWQGDITTLRFDPMANNGAWEIEKIELIFTGKAQTLKVDGEEMVMELPMEAHGGDVFVAFYPKSKLMRKLNIAHRWVKAKAKVTLLIGEHEAVFTAGSDEMVLDGKNVKLPDAVYLVDGVPALPMGVVCKVAGYRYTYDGNNMEVFTK